MAKKLWFIVLGVACVVLGWGVVAGLGADRGGVIVQTFNRVEHLSYSEFNPSLYSHLTYHPATFRSATIVDPLLGGTHATPVAISPQLSRIVNNTGTALIFLMLCLILLWDLWHGNNWPRRLYEKLQGKTKNSATPTSHT